MNERLTGKKFSARPCEIEREIERVRERAREIERAFARKFEKESEKGPCRESVRKEKVREWEGREREETDLKLVKTGDKILVMIWNE